MVAKKSLAGKIKFKGRIVYADHNSSYQGNYL